MRSSTCGGEGLPSNAGALERRLALISSTSPRRSRPAGGRCRGPAQCGGRAQLSVTQIEAWRRNPYAIYARHILRLKALDPLDQDPGAADLGNAVHEALHEFTERVPARLAERCARAVARRGRSGVPPWLDRPNVWAFWQPRFQRIAAWWLKKERERRTPLMTSIATEVDGALELCARSRPPFTLTARADRIDTFRDGSLTIIDYKTGRRRSRSDIERGFAPQLRSRRRWRWPARFDGVAAARWCAELAHWQL